MWASCVTDVLIDLANEPRGRIFLKNLLDGIRIGLIDSCLGRRVVSLIESKASDPRPTEELSWVLDAVLRDTVDEGGTTPIHHMPAYFEDFELSLPQTFATTQNLKFLRGVIEGAEGEHIHIIEGLGDLFDGELSEAHQNEIEAKIHHITAEFSDEGFFDAKVVSALAGPHLPHLGPFWITFAAHERFLGCTELPDYRRPSERADFVRDRLGLIHLSNQDFMVCYLFEYSGEPNLMISRSSALHGTGWRFRQLTPFDNVEAKDQTGRTVDLKKLIDEAAEVDGAPELVMDRFVPETPASIKISVLGRPMLRDDRAYDKTPDGDEVYASKILQDTDSATLVEELISALENGESAS